MGVLQHLVRALALPTTTLLLVANCCVSGKVWAVACPEAVLARDPTLAHGRRTRSSTVAWVATLTK